jgi:hypothetical protein
VCSSDLSKTKVTVQIKLGKNGCDCPLLTFKKGKKTYYQQAVSTWYINGKKTAYGTVMSRAAKANYFKKHTTTVVMKMSLAKGTYKVYLDNGKAVHKLTSKLVVGSKPVSKTYKF